MNPVMTSGVTTAPAILDAMELTSDPELEGRFAESAHQILADLVGGGAALGWVEPPSRDEVAELPPWTSDHLLRLRRDAAEQPRPPDVSGPVQCVRLAAFTDGPTPPSWRLL
jgi:hypothetical protein